MIRPKIYGASVLKHAQMWKDLRTSAPQIDLICTWPYTTSLEENEAPPETFRGKESAMATAWHFDHQEIILADALVLYAEPEDRLRGALVEAGMAIALGKPVYLVGSNWAFGSWQYHPQVHRHEGTLSELIANLAGV